MRRTLQLVPMLMLALVMCALPSIAATEPKDVQTLKTFLQDEVNMIAVLTAQSNYLQQQNDPLGAALVTSYIPDHSLQASNLSAMITALGSSPGGIVANSQPFLGTRDAILMNDQMASQRFIDQYKHLLAITTADNCVDIHRLAQLGLNAASRHFNSLTFARLNNICDAKTVLDGLVAALTLERGQIVDLQAQLTRLMALMDQGNANIVSSFIPLHQRQAGCLEAMITQLGGNPALAMPTEPVALASASEIIFHQRVVETQFVNTYAVPIASLPQGALRLLALQGQTASLFALRSLPGQPVLAAVPNCTTVQ